MRGLVAIVFFLSSGLVLAAPSVEPSRDRVCPLSGDQGCRLHCSVFHGRSMGSCIGGKCVCEPSANERPDFTCAFGNFGCSIHCMVFHGVSGGHCVNDDVNKNRCSCVTY
ncbi:uncharacterized protein VTP21DRAFT_2563 [Calcarisporiella thermophila]|uniref:uncharacterized protein n=1 Tax=Calcarisporiella thermophila TaxID=911321 RepID=UPI003742465B